MEKADVIREMLEPLIQRAREEEKWLWCSYQDLWFSPDALTLANARGKFLWGPVNWHLRDPMERLREAQSRADEAQAEADRIRAEIR